MGKKYKFFLIGFVAVVAALVLLVVKNKDSIALLSPEGKIAGQQTDLLLFASALSLIVIIPVFILAFFILGKYHEKNSSAKYDPNWDSSHKLEILWWGIPIILMVILAVVTWKSSHDLDPYKEIQSNKSPVTIQVVALEWKWLFIYPEQKIATVNHITVPEDRPINFKITADAPMNSFWIPKLGGQVYAMAGMETKLHLMADQKGTYQGVAANLSGEGHAGMKFTVNSVSEGDFATWINSTRQNQETLNKDNYIKLAEKSKDVPKKSYSNVDPNLYGSILYQYMHHGNENKDDDKQKGHH